MAKNRTVVLDFSEVRDAWVKTMESGEVAGISSRQPMYSTMQGYAQSPSYVDSWIGASPSQTANWIREGYRAPEFEHSAEFAVMSEGRRWAYNEDDGEIEMDRVFEGHDAIFLDREPAEIKPGLRLMFEFAFACGTSNKVISQYGTWCASLIASLESSGYDLVVDVWIHLDDLYREERSRVSLLLRVKQENELSNFTDWSALFAPSGYRHLGFLAKNLSAEKLGYTVTYGFGTTIGGQEWGVSYDRDMQTVQVHVNQRAGNKYFPGDKLNEAAMKEGLIPSPIVIAS